MQKQGVNMLGVVVAFVSQKGGVGKSTLSRGFATSASKNSYSVKMVDLDTQQGTVSEWHRNRLNNGYDSIGSVEVFAKASEAVKHSNEYDFTVIDGAARASSATLSIAKCADLVVIPSCVSTDDLLPAVKLAHELKKNGIPRENIALALTRVSTQSEIEDAREYIEQAGYTVVDGYLPEKASYRLAQNEGLSIIETRYETMNEKANHLIGSIISLLS